MSCTNSEKILVGPYGETYPASHDPNQAMNIIAEEVSDSQEEADPVQLTFQEIKAEPENCTNLENALLGPYGETYPTPHDADQAMNVKTEAASDAEEEEEPVPITFPEIKTEPEVAPSSPSTFSGPTPTVNSFAQPSRKRKSAPSSHDLLTKATRYLEAEDDEFLILAKGYAVKLRKLTQQQLMFADKVINETLLDGQMGLLTRGSYLVHPSGPLSTSSPSSSWSSNSYSQHAEPQTARTLLEGFSYDDNEYNNLQ